jgi:MFS transporter, PHS family, inorganic phosphate transporter
MLAAVFLAQSVGRILAYGISLGVLHGLTGQIDPAARDLLDQTKIALDIFWRLALSLAGIPAVFALVFRLFIPETPRFYSAVKRDIKKARESLTMLGTRTPEMIADIERVIVAGPDDASSILEKRPWRKTAREYYFGQAKGWKLLAAISIQWLLLDIVWYGVGLDSPGTLAALWLDKEPPQPSSAPPSWNVDPAYPNATIVETIDRNLERTLYLSCIAALLGSLAVIPLVNRLSRKTHYLWTTWSLAVLFAVMAISVSQTYAKPNHQVSVVFYVIAQLLFNLGPNTLTFIIAAESFPTEFRGTSYGIAAAFGKVGAIIARGIIKGAGKGKTGIVVVLAIFCVVLVIMAVLVWLEPCGIAFPRMQKDRSLDWHEIGPLERLKRSKLENKSLEEISPWPLVDVEGDDELDAPEQRRSASLSDGESRVSRVENGIPMGEMHAQHNGSSGEQIKPTG